MRITILFFLFIISAIHISAQEYVSENAPMRVIHCTAITQDQNVKNIFVDDNNTKWAATDENIYQINSADNSTKKSVSKNEWSLVMQPEGNGLFSTNKFNLEMLPDSPEDITCTYYDKGRKQLLVGTKSNGVLRYKTSPEIKLLDSKNYSTAGVSNQVTALLVDKYKRTWVGTDKGVFMDNGKKMKAYEEGTYIDEITALGPDVWILGGGVLNRVSPENRWLPGDVDARTYRGKIRDMVYDNDGKLWVASDIITRYDIIKDSVEVFDRTNGFTAKNIQCIRVDKDNALWVGTEASGLFLIDKEASMTISCVISQELSCTGTTDDAALEVKVYGGEEPYTYTWSEGLAGSNPQMVGPGKYAVTVTDQAGRTKTVGAVIEDNRMRVKVDRVKATTHTASNDGIAVVEVSGGQKPYAITWTSGEKDKKAKALGAGAQTVTVRDNLGCTYSESIDMGGGDVVAVNSQGIILSIDQEGELTCTNKEGVSLIAQVTGGRAPYQYEWNNKSDQNSITNLTAGEYKVTVVDANGNRKISAYKVVGPTPLLVTVKQDKAVTGSRRRDGVASAFAKGGAGGYLYEWSNGAIGPKASKLVRDNYSVTVTDQDGCTSEASISMKESANQALAGAKLKKGQVIQLDKLYFEADSTDITARSIPMLDEVYDMLLRKPKTKIEIGGHTNNIPSEEYCDLLSTARAKSVADYLVAKGIPATQVTYKGYGKRAPLVSNDTARGRKRNQRVEIKVLSTR
jgi:outer membrane protein OmpA-like peptidoglycan-associated protein